MNVLYIFFIPFFLKSFYNPESHLYNAIMTMKIPLDDACSEDWKLHTYAHRNNKKQ